MAETAPRPRQRSGRHWARKPAVALDVTLDLKDGGLSGTATIKVTSRSTRAEKSPLLVCAVLREDGVVTDVPSGENAGKSLVARFPARQTKYEFIELDGKSPATQLFPFVIEPTWKRQNLRLAVFVQDKRTGRGPPGDRPPLAIDSYRRSDRDVEDQGVNGGTLISRLPTFEDPRNGKTSIPTQWITNGRASIDIHTYLRTDESAAPAIEVPECLGVVVIALSRISTVHHTTAPPLTPIGRNAQATLRQPGSVGAPRGGSELLTGILVCRACGRPCRRPTEVSRPPITCRKQGEVVNPGATRSSGRCLGTGFWPNMIGCSL